MKQSIGEGFTLDVLKSFTPVKRWFKLKGKGEDVELPESRGKKELIKWVDSNPKPYQENVVSSSTTFSIQLLNLLKEEEKEW